MKPKLLVIILLATLLSGIGLSKTDSYYERSFQEIFDKILKGDYNSIQLILFFEKLDEIVDYVNVKLADSIYLKLKTKVNYIKDEYEAFFYYYYLLRYAILRGFTSDIEYFNQKLNWIQLWLCVGPFENEGGIGFDKEFPPEGSSTTYKDSFTGRNNRVLKWEKVYNLNLEGYIDLREVLWSEKNSCNYAVSFIFAPENGKYRFYLGVSGSYKLWIDNVLVSQRREIMDGYPFREGVEVSLEKGWHKIKLKICREEVGSGIFWLNIKGEKVREIKFSNDPDLVNNVNFGKLLNKKYLKTPFLQLFEPNKIKERIDEDLIQLIYYTGSYDLRNAQLDDLIKKLIEERPTLENIKLGIKATKIKNLKIEYLNKAAALFPEDPEIISNMIQFKTELTQLNEIKSYLDRLNRFYPEDILTILTNVRIYSLFNLNNTVSEYLLKKLPLYFDTPYFLYLLIDYLKASNRTREANNFLETYLEIRPSDLGSLEEVIKLARNKRELSKIDTLADKLLYYFSARSNTYIYLYKIYFSLGRVDKALSILYQGIERFPSSLDILKELAEYFWITGDKYNGLKYAKRYLEIKPNEPSLIYYISLWSGEGEFAEPYLLSQNEIREIRETKFNSSITGFHYTVLLDNTIVNIYPNGLASRYIQYSVYINDNEGARQWSNYSIETTGDQILYFKKGAVIHPDGSEEMGWLSYSYSPYDPEIKIYFDLKRHVIELPNVKKGDIIVLEYIITDTNYRVYFLDYFSDFKLIGSTVPKLYFQYILLAPLHRRLYFYYPEKLLKFNVTLKGDMKEYKWNGDQIPYVIPEDYMPGISEVVPYLHISYYNSWEDVGKWYWSLIKDQFVVNQKLREIVESITKEAKTDLDKAKSIYYWVLDNTRYIALEFGIYGYKPYNTVQILERGFGDCKDKATLLKTMLEFAGIKANIALIRTRDLGMVTPFPPSLSIFNHAIVYLPDFNVWLDGTAEMYSFGTIPSMDQGGFALIIDPEKPYTTTLPFTEPEDNLTEEKIDISLDKNGVARATLSITIRGNKTSTLRYELQAEISRIKRIEPSIHKIYPGAIIDYFNLENLNDRELPLKIEMRLTIPNFGMVSGEGEILLPLFVPMDITSVVALAQRRFPLILDYKSKYHTFIKIRLPAGYRLVNIPQPLEIREQFLCFNSNLNAKEGVIEVEQQLLINTTRVSQDEYEKFREISTQIFKYTTTRFKAYKR